MTGPGIRLPRGLRLALLAVAVALMGLMAPVAAHAATTVTVTTPSDSPTAGQCSLREAVLYANGTAEPGCAPGTATPPTTIKLPAGTYTLTGSGVAMTAAATIDGAGAARTTISGGSAVQPITVASTAVVTLDRVTITGGVSGVPSTGCTGTGFLRTCPAENGNDGGGIANAGNLTLSGVVVSGNVASGGTLPFSSIVVFCTIQGCPPRPGKSGGNGGNGGGIDNTGTLTVNDSTVTNNTAGAGASATSGVSGTGTGASPGQDGGDGGQGGSGGGIYNDAHATLTITDSTISGNHAGAGGNAGSGSNATSASDSGGNAGSAGIGGFGGGIASLNQVQVAGSTVTANETGAGGGGGNGGQPTGTGTVGSSTDGGIGGFGGGLYVFGNLASNSLTNVTVTQNATAAGGTGGFAPGLGGFGGGIYARALLVQLSFVTVAGNIAVGGGGGITNDGGVTEADSIVSSNTGSTPANCDGTITDNGHNLVFGDSSCPGTNADPRLGPLADNGGPTQTRALQAGSGAINLVPLTSCPVPTDQRGVTRPQGSRCDAGAYEFAPPTITAPAASAGSTSGTISAAINPNLRDTQVVVRYGRTGLGSSTATRHIGAGNNDIRVSIPINRLARGRTYHARIVATNGDGTTTSQELTFTTGQTVAILSASTRVSTKGGVLKLKIACRGLTSGRCSGPITVTSHVTKRGGRPVAVSARVKPRRTRTLVIVAAGRYSVPAGATRTITLKLNRTGRSLLKRFHRLPATLTVSGAKPPTRRIVFTAPKPKHKKHHRS